MSEQLTGQDKSLDSNDLDEFMESENNSAQAYRSFEDTDNEVKIQPIPKWLLWVGIFLLLLIGSAVILSLLSTNSNSELITKDAIEKTDEIPVSQALDISTDPITKEPDFSSLESPLIEIPSETELKLTQLQEQLSQLIADNTIRQDSQDALIKAMESQLLAQSTKIQQLQDNLKSRKQAVKPRKKVVNRYRRPRIPFTLVSVDQWGNDLYAVVRFQGQLYELTYGQGTQGWHVSTFDQKRGAVTFKNKSGSRKELLIQS